MAPRLENDWPGLLRPSGAAVHIPDSDSVPRHVRGREPCLVQPIESPDLPPGGIPKFFAIPVK